MSNPTEILVEKLKLQRLLYERVFVKWEDESVVPPDADFTDPSKPHLISNIDELSYLDASAIHDAQLSDSVYVFRIQFDLITNGFIITKKKKNTIIKPWNTTSKELICGLESLSRTKTFTVYIKPNDYALVGIQELRNRFSKTGSPTDLHKPNMKEMYIRYVPELVEWSSDPISLPPVYTENRQLIPEVQVPRSPPIIFEQQTPSINTIEAAIAETPARTPASSNSTSVHAIVPPSHEETPARTATSPDCTSVHGIFSPSREELSGSQVSLNDIEEASRYMEMDFNVDSDEEQLAKEQFAKLDSREPSQQQIDHPLEVSQMLNSKFLKWLQTALGNTARVVALDTRHNKDKYYDQKCVCILHTLTEFSKPGVSEESSKSVSGKGLGTDSNASKRLKM
ncbi:lim domain-containing serine threonine- kinase protein [Rutstroemia sp. NJR-2017a WRK4]|nr:lim domain-containing serine threonine- kinase protein [Rutstroemia sp. NJR-2017a WRK4]